MAANSRRLIISGTRDGIIPNHAGTLNTTRNNNYMTPSATKADFVRCVSIHLFLLAAKGGSHLLGT